jgi:tRNA modification GTPase
MSDNAAAYGAYGDDSPITAFATIPGNSALTLIRCSGKGSIEILASVFAHNKTKLSGEKIKNAPGNTVVHGWIVCANEIIDEVLVSIFRAPKSYTGEDSLDISCHGGHAAGKAVINALKSAGFRDALNGEFTFRAFMNGKLDLTKSESVMELVSAKTETSRRHALTRLAGSLLEQIIEIKKMLVQILAACEINLDYSQDEIDSDAPQENFPDRDTALAALAMLKKLSASWKLERLYQEGITVVIAGRPNAGKSSLFNCLLKEDRSIVTEIPGTTRDWIEGWISIEGIPVRLVDTAGLRETGDSVERMGVEQSRKLIDEAYLVLYLIDGEQGFTEEDKNFLCDKKLYVWNKADITPFAVLMRDFEIAANNIVSVSAKTGEGIAELTTAIASLLSRQEGLKESEISVSLGTARQKNLVDTAYRSLEEAIDLGEKAEPLDLIAPLLREAVNALGEITGEVTTSDILEEMFSRFCVGK